MAIFLRIWLYRRSCSSMRLAAHKPSMPDLSGYGDFVSGRCRTQMIKQPAQPRGVVMLVRVSGVLSLSTTDSDKFLHMIISMACHGNRRSLFHIVLIEHSLCQEI